MIDGKQWGKVTEAEEEFEDEIKDGFKDEEVEEYVWDKIKECIKDEIKDWIEDELKGELKWCEVVCASLTTVFSLSASIYLMARRRAGSRICGNESEDRVAPSRMGC